MQLQATKRELLGKKSKKVFKDGLVPAVMYGHGIENVNISVNSNDFAKIYKESGESTIIDLKIDDSEIVKTIIKETQLDLSGEKITHIDFYQVKMDEKITTDIELKFIGEAPAVKLGGTLITNMNEVSVECFPDKLVHEIEVDLSVLDDFEKNILVKDIKAPEGIKILNEATESVMIVEAPRKAEEEKPAEVAPTVEAEKKTAEKKPEEKK